MRKPKTRAKMIEYLTGHARYWTLHSRNGSSSYSRCVKIHILTFSSNEIRSRAYDMLDVPEAFEEGNAILRDFDAAHKYLWQIETNGRSGGYLVLIKGGRRPSGYKSYCTECGQKNFNAVKDSGKKCGRCNKLARRDYNEEHFDIFTQPGLGIDDSYPDFPRLLRDWDTKTLKERVDLVWAFDQACDLAVSSFIDFCETHVVEDKEIMVPKTIKIARRVKEG